MAAARRPLANLPNLGFWKLFGSGSGEGFTLKPNTGVYAVLTTWPDLDTARSTLNSAKVFDRYRTHADEDWTLYLSADSVRGEWSGEAPFSVSNPSQTDQVAVLTRATIKPKNILKFWKRVPNISQTIGTNTDVLFKIGIGETPGFQQVTFSIWPNNQSIAAFARRSHHKDAIKAVRDGNWFREELYARFSLLADEGSWDGASPLSRLETQ